MAKRKKSRDEHESATEEKVAVAVPDVSLYDLDMEYLGGENLLTALWDVMNDTGYEIPDDLRAQAEALLTTLGGDVVCDFESDSSLFTDYVELGYITQPAKNLQMFYRWSKLSQSLYTEIHPLDIDFQPAFDKFMEECGYSERDDDEEEDAEKESEEE